MINKTQIEALRLLKQIGWRDGKAHPLTEDGYWFGTWDDWFKARDAIITASLTVGAENSEIVSLVLAARDFYNRDGEMTADALRQYREALRNALQPFKTWGREV